MKYQLLGTCLFNIVCDAMESMQMTEYQSMVVLSRKSLSTFCKLASTTVNLVSFPQIKDLLVGSSNDNDKHDFFKQHMMGCVSIWKICLSWQTNIFLMINA